MQERVLVVGFGKIGRLKAQKWRKLKCDVYVWDTSTQALETAQEIGYKISNNLSMEVEYVDICVPTSFHIMYMTDLRFNVIKKMLVEKPVVSNMRDWKKLNNFLDNYPDRAEKIFVSEQYYYSNALREIKKVIDGHKILSIDIRMNKNRTIDNSMGRFVDYDLRSYGIELPHMIAILDFFNSNWDQINFDSMNNFYVQREKIDSGCRLKGQYNHISFGLESFLGEYRYDTFNHQIKNVCVDRQLTIHTNYEELGVIFDPVLGIERYNSKIVSSKKELILKDDMLENMLSGVLSNHMNKRNNVRNALRVSKFLIDLKSKSHQKIFLANKQQNNSSRRAV